MRSGQGQSGQAIKLFQTHRKKIVFTFHFWYKSFILDYMKLAELSDNRFEWKNVTFLWGQNILWSLLHIFRGQDPQPPESTPLYVRSHAGSQLTSKKPAKSVGLSVRQSRPNERAATPRPTIYISNKGQWRMVISTIKFSKIKNHNRNRKITHSSWKEREGVIRTTRSWWPAGPGWHTFDWGQIAAAERDNER